MVMMPSCVSMSILANMSYFWVKSASFKQQVRTTDRNVSRIFHVNAESFGLLQSSNQNSAGCSSPLNSLKYLCSFWYCFVICQSLWLLYNFICNHAQHLTSVSFSSSTQTKKDQPVWSTSTHPINLKSYGSLYQLIFDYSLWPKASPKTPFLSQKGAKFTHS